MNDGHIAPSKKNYIQSSGKKWPYSRHTARLTTVISGLLIRGMCIVVGNSVIGTRASSKFNVTDIPFFAKTHNIQQHPHHIQKGSIVIALFVLWVIVQATAIGGDARTNTEVTLLDIISTV